MLRVTLRGAVLVSLLALAACKKAELGDPVPEGIDVSVDKAALSADDGSVTVEAIVYEDGIALLDHAVTIEITGTVSATAVTVSTDPVTGIASHTFQNLRLAGTGTVTARAGAPGEEVSASAPITVVPGAVAAITVTPGNQTVSADVGSLSVTASAADAWSNAVPNPSIVLSTNAPGATLQGGSMENLRVAGSWKVYGTLAGATLVDDEDFVVSPGAAAQVKTALGNPVVAQQGTIKIYCSEMDGYGNGLTESSTFSAGTEVFTTPASTIAAIANTAGAFTATGFASAGVYTATCSNGTRVDTSDFQVTAQAASSSVLATVDKSVVEAGMTASVTCRQYDSFGNPTSATFDPGAGEVTATAGAITGGVGNTFTITGLTTKGTFAATCSKAGSGSDSDDFAVVDTTAPTISSWAITGATSHNGPLDGRHGPFETLTLTVVASDVVGIAKEEISSHQGSMSVLTPAYLEAGETARTRTFDVLVLGGNATFDRLVIRVQVSDTTGNASIRDVELTFDPAASFTTNGATMRTWFESSTPLLDAAGLTSSNGTMYVKTLDVAADTIWRIAAGSSATTATMIATDFVPGVPDDSIVGLEHVAGGFGGFNLFHPVTATTGAMLGFNPAGNPATFSAGPIFPLDVAFGTVNSMTSLYYVERGVAGAEPTKINRLDSFGALNTYYDDTAAGDLFDAAAIAVRGSELIVGEFDAAGDLWSLSGAAPSPAPIVSLGLPIYDVAVDAAGTLLAATDGPQLHKVTGTTPDVIVFGVDATAIEVVENVLWVYDNASSRLYRVTGY